MSMFRHPKTTQERREDAGADADDEIPLRPRERPTAWDDLNKPRKGRGWKAWTKRAKQYEEEP